jgi:biofilm PGA synthesis protein PgaA
MNVSGSACCALILLALSGGTTLALTAEQEARHALAIERARAGEFESALDELEALRRLAPTDRRLRYDSVLVRVWSGDWEGAWQLGGELETGDMPSATLEALALAARRSGRHDDSARLYAQLLARDPAREEAAIGQALNLVDAGRDADAELAFAQLAATFPASANRLLAEAWFRSRRGQWLAALELFQNALRLRPQSAEAESGLAEALLALGAPVRASELAPRGNRELRARLEAERAAQWLRWGYAPALPGEARFAATDRALVALERMGGTDCRDLDLGDPFNQRICLDALTGLRDRQRYREARALGERLQGAGLELPLYARVAWADALLATRAPEEAAVEYRRILEEAPDHPTATASLFYALLDAEQHREAFTLLDESLAEANHRGQQRRSLDLSILSALSRLYADNLIDARRRLAALEAANPGSADLRLARAALERGLGHPRAAATALDAHLAERPQDFGAQVARAELSMDRTDIPAVRQAVEDLRHIDPEHPRLARLERDLYAMHQSELVLAGEHRSAEVQPDAETFLGLSSVQLDGWLFAPPVDEGRTRAYLRSRLLTAEVPEGTPTDIRLGAGVETLRRDLRLRAEASQGLEDVDIPSLAAFARWQADDHWELEGQVEFNTFDLPLRAAAVGTTANAVGLAIVHRWHAYLRASLAWRHTAFSDDNSRNAVAAALERRFWWTPSQSLGLRADVGASRNSLTGRNYFNPESDLSWAITAEHRWRLWRRFEQSLEQRIRLSGGGYYQKREEAAAVLSATYLQEFRWTPYFAINYGLTRARQVFDGNPEQVLIMFAGLDARF